MLIIEVHAYVCNAHEFYFFAPTIDDLQLDVVLPVNPFTIRTAVWQFDLITTYLRHLSDDYFKLSLRVLLSSVLILKSTRPYESGNRVILDLRALLCACCVMHIKLTF